MLGLLSRAQVNAQSNYWIVGGQNAAEGQFPWLGDIRLSNANYQEHLCGSALIHPYWVITAAHCLTDPDFNTTYPAFIRLNTVSTNTQSVNPNGGVSVAVDTFYRHTSFNYNQPMGTGYDVALIKLKEPVTSIIPISLPQQSDTAHYYQANRIVTTAGWGLIDTFSTQPADIMKWTYSKIIARAKCNEYYQNNSSITPLTERVVCVGYEGNEPQSGSGSGDSGGPLWIDSNGTKYLIGVVSGAENYTTLHERPSVYTNIAYFRPWIDSVMNAQPAVPSSLAASGSLNDENVFISVNEHQIKLKIGNVPSHNIFVQLTNIEGKILYKQKFHKPQQQTYQIPVANFAAGMYVIRIYDNSGNHMYRKLQHVSH